MSYLNDNQGEREKKRGVGIFFSNRQISWMLSSFVLFSFFIFIAGYFLGKKKATQKFYQKVNQESFADRIYYSVCSMNEQDDSSARQESTEEDTVDVAKGKIVTGQGDVAANQEKNKPRVEESASVTQSAAQAQVQQAKTVAVAISVKDRKKYYAELIGFGTLGAARRFSNRMNKQDLSVTVKRRKSKTSKGKTITWYQVITEKFDNKNDLIAFVDIIKDKERLKGIRIVQC